VPTPTLDTAVPALTLKVGSYPNHHGGLAVARTLGRCGVPVYGVHESRFAPAGLSRYTTGRFVWSTADEGDHQRQLLEGIAAVAERIGRRAVLVPTDDHAATFVCDHAHELRDWFLVADQSPDVVHCVTDKVALHRQCQRLGVASPPATVATSPDDLARYAGRGAFPVVVKRGRPLLLGNGRRARSTCVVRTPDELMALDVDAPLLLQEHIPAGEDWLFHGYCDHRSECVVAFTGRKLRSWPTGAGETAFGRAEANPVLEGDARALCQALGYRGVMSLDYRYDRRDGRYNLLDFNPRTGAIFRLFETDAGVDVVRALHLDLTGRAVPRGRQVSGRVVAVEGYDLRAFRAERRARTLTVRQWAASWRTVDETAWLATDDVVPAVVAIGRVAAGARRFRPAPPHFIPGRRGRRR